MQRNNQNNPTEELSRKYSNAITQVKRDLKHFDKKIMRSAPKGTQYDWLNNSSFQNIVYPRWKIPDRLLRMVETRNAIVGSIITLREQQAAEFSNISHDKDIPGWEFALKDDKETLSPARKKKKEFLENFYTKMRRDDYSGLLRNHDNFKKTFNKYVRDRTLIDKITWEIERDRKGEAVANWCLDGATIMPVLPGGYYGSVSQIGMGVSVGYSNLADEIAKVRMSNIPPQEEIAYVQELFYGAGSGGITAAFREEDLIYDLGNEINDILLYKQGLSVVEKANITVTAFIKALNYNINGISRGAIPKIAIALGRESGYTPEQMEDAGDEWMANFQGEDGQWNIPLLNGDAKVLNLLNTNREMEYQKYIEFVAALTCACCGADAAELGLRLSQAQNVLNDNQDAKQLFSKNRGIRDLFSGFVDISNRWLEMSGFSFAQDWVFRFNGLSTTDKSFETDLRKKNVESIMTVDEVRAQLDMKPLPDGQGAIILNSVWLQNKQGMEQQAAQAEMEGAGGEESGVDEDEFGDMAEEAMDSLEKAVRLM